MNCLLWSKDQDLVQDDHFFLIGPDLPESFGQELDYAQLILAALHPGPELNLFRMESLQFLPGIIPGVMARMIPGRLWLRVSKDALSHGINFSLLAKAIRRAAQAQAPELVAMESIFITAGKEAVERFSGLASEAKILSGRHRKISLGLSGGYECLELNCDHCEEKQVCDTIREVRVIRRKSR